MSTVALSSHWYSQRFDPSKVSRIFNAAYEDNGKPDSLKSNAPVYQHAL